MFVESAIGITVVGFIILMAAIVVPVIVFAWSFVYRIAFKPLVERLPEPAKKVLEPLLAVPDIRPKFLRKQAAKRTP